MLLNATNSMLASLVDVVQDWSKTAISRTFSNSAKIKIIMTLLGGALNFIWSYKSLLCLGFNLSESASPLTTLSNMYRVQFLSSFQSEYWSMNGWLFFTALLAWRNQKYPSGSLEVSVPFSVKVSQGYSSPWWFAWRFPNQTFERDNSPCLFWRLCCPATLPPFDQKFCLERYYFLVQCLILIGSFGSRDRPHLHTKPWCYNVSF